ncbi:ubiquitin-like domain-containing protein CIP73 isoform X1 [Nymphaea colorata]|uniref:ubiquitin-like domain-containing protein CIP73 isoform X1 n=1 Tax=Nymphaea colorata TaxID=210225 RepID=UPI00129D2F3A|nr:ubiquitin-like domain-containing protein CIP73 isoform X1 [Nymphaea colorata]
MGSHGTDEVMIPSEMEPNCSEAIVEIKIKTLDSQTYTLRVNKYMPVPALKEQIATVTGVLSEQQRLICRGKVLKDDQLLSAYHVEDGHTLHLVVRQPFHSSSTSGAGSTGPERMPNQSGADPVASSTRGQGNTVAAHSVVLGTFNVSDQGDAAMSDVNRFLSAVLTSVGLVNRGARNEESDSGPQVTGPERRERLVGTTVMMDPAPRHQPSLATYRAQLDSLHGGAFRFPTSMSAGPLLPLVIPDSLTTLSQYLHNMRQEFSINGQDHDINLPAGEAHNLESHNPDTVARADLVQGGLPTPAALAEVATSTRQFLIEQVGDCLSQLARQLQEEANVTDPMVRTSIQSSAMRTGVLLQNAGALLLELGRATMTLRMGQTTSEAVVNAGPPVFISTTGPNPIMVQSLPFIPGTGFGTIPMGIMHPGHALANGALGTGFVPRTIDIRIRTGSSGSADQGEHAAGTQVGASDQARPTGGGISMQNVSPSSGFPSVATESGGVRVVPVRTVVAAVPAAVSRPASDASSGGALGVFYPLLARIQNLDPGHFNDASRSTRAGDHHRNTETDEHQVSESSIRSQNVYSARENSSINFCSNDTAPQHQGASASNPSEPSQAVPTTTASDVQAGASAPSDGNQQGYMSEAFSRFDQFLRTVFSGNHMHSGTGIPGLSTGLRETFPQNEQSGEASGIPQTDRASGTALDQGMFLSQVLHQAMPFIHQHLAQEASPPLVSGACHETSTSANTTIDTPASSSSENIQRQPPGTDSSQQVERKRTCDGAGNDLQHIDGPDSSPPDCKRQRSD